MVLLLLAACAPDVSVSKYEQAPEVAITFPTDGASVTEGSALNFRAEVVDADTPWESLSYTWSKGDGSLLSGTNTPDESGTSFAADPLPNGAQMITVTVVDGDGLEARDSVSFDVVSGSPPVVAFVTPYSDQRYALGQDIDVDVVVSDDDAPDLNTIELVWEGDGASAAPTTPNSDGHASFRLDPLDLGAYSLSVTATDTEGGSNRAVVYFDVVAGDADGDGYDDPEFGGDDCDDTDATVHPGADETCNEVDDDCDGDIDEDAVDASAWYDDDDADSFGGDSVTWACDAPAGTVADSSDCDDGDNGVYPGAPETCDGVDEDCDGEIDEDAMDAPTWFGDADSDSFGDADAGVAACDAPTGTVADASDCDDTDNSVFPGAPETCDGVDEDCDGSIDESATDAPTWYADTDGDTYGDADAATASCTSPTDHVADDTDCDDADVAIHPGAEDICDGVDNDCDGDIDEDSPEVGAIWYRDADGDGYGESGETLVACGEPEGWVATDGDCDDTEDDVFPGADELCNERDDDCDGAVDDTPIDPLTVYADDDGDGFGDADAATTACALEDGFTLDDNDCDDGDAAINPDATEVCNGDDDDCDTLVDDADPDVTGTSIWYGDADDDGWGGTTAVAACVAPADHASRTGDCDDSDADVSPSGRETCASDADEDCDGDNNEVDALGCIDWFVDSDGDGWGGDASACLCDAEGSYQVDIDGDCDDDEASAYPGGTELCGDDIDQDCDGNDAICPLEGDFDLEDADIIYTGTAASMYTGEMVGYCPDLDGDGLDDVWIAAPSYKLDRGIFWSLPGVIEGPTPVSDAYTTITGTTTSEGLSTHAFADFDGDGTPDLAIGAYNWTTDASSDGAVWFYSGPTSGGSWAPNGFATATFYGTASYDRLGYGVAGADFDGDGVADLAMGGSGYDGGGSDSGAVWVAYGPLGSGTAEVSTAELRIDGDGNGDSFGRGLTHTDLDGDGVADLVANAFCEDSGGSCSGTVYVYALDGSTTTIGADDYDWRFVGDVASQQYGLGTSTGLPLLKGIADVTGDGIAELYVGSESDDTGGSNAGSVIIVPGSSTRASGTSWTLDRVGAELTGAAAEDRLASADAGDVDADGTPDLVVGGGGVDTGGSAAGAAYLFYGPIALTSYDASESDATLIGPSASDGAGASVAASADVNGDGFADVLVGGLGDDTAASNSGAGWLFWGTAR